MTIPDCRSCGACCFSKLATYVRVSGADHTRLGTAAEQLTGFIGNRCYMRMHDGHCSALVVQGDGQFVCSVYADRPEVCRALERESAECRAERTLKAERSLASLAARAR